MSKITNLHPEIIELIYWHERSMDSLDAKRLERHVKDCSACQAQLAGIQMADEVRNVHVIPPPSWNKWLPIHRKMKSRNPVSAQFPSGDSVAVGDNFRSLPGTTKEFRYAAKGAKSASVDEGLEHRLWMDEKSTATYTRTKRKVTITVRPKGKSKISFSGKDASGEPIVATVEKEHGAYVFSFSTGGLGFPVHLLFKIGLSKKNVVL